MKIIKAGNPNPHVTKAWWEGVVLTCPTCKAEFALDENDEDDVETLVARTPEGPRTVSIFCPNGNCGSKVSGTFRYYSGVLVANQ